VLVIDPMDWFFQLYKSPGATRVSVTPGMNVEESRVTSGCPVKEEPPLL
jgi:hypothetical protein